MWSLSNTFHTSTHNPRQGAHASGNLSSTMGTNPACRHPYNRLNHWMILPKVSHKRATPIPQKCSKATRRSRMNIGDATQKQIFDRNNKYMYISMNICSRWKVGGNDSPPPMLLLAKTQGVLVWGFRVRRWGVGDIWGVCELGGVRGDDLSSGLICRA